MREPINLEIVSPGSPRFAWAQEFSRGFRHLLWEDRPVVMVKRGQKWVGHAQFITHPIGITGWHTDPTVCSPRDVLEGSAALRSWQQGNNAGGDVIIAVFDSDMKMNDAVIAHLGFRPMGCQLYLSNANP